MERITAQTVISASQDRVFDVFTDFERAPERVRAIKRLELLTDGPAAEGTTWRETRQMFGRVETLRMKIAAMQRPHNYTITCKAHGGEYATDFQFATVENGTRVTMVFRFQPRSRMAKLMSPMSRMLSGTIRKFLKQDLQDLKNACEPQRENETAGQRVDSAQTKAPPLNEWGESHATK